MSCRSLEGLPSLSPVEDLRVAQREVLGLTQPDAGSWIEFDTYASPCQPVLGSRNTKTAAKAYDASCCALL